MAKLCVLLRNLELDYAPNQYTEQQLIIIPAGIEVL